MTIFERYEQSYANYRRAHELRMNTSTFDSGAWQNVNTKLDKARKEYDQAREAYIAEVNGTN